MLKTPNKICTLLNMKIMLLNSLIYLLYLSCHYYLQILKLVNSKALNKEPQSKYLTLIVLTIWESQNQQSTRPLYETYSRTT